MKRVLIMLALAAAAGVGAYGQSKLAPERPSNDAIQEGVVYQAGFCGTGIYASTELKVTKRLNGGWFEAEQGYANRETGEMGGATILRFNQAQLCYVKPIVP